MSAASSLDDGKSQAEPPEVAEMRSKGTVGARVYMAYLTAGGNCCTMIFLQVMFLMTQLMISSGDYWLSYW